MPASSKKLNKKLVVSEISLVALFLAILALSAFNIQKYFTVTKLENRVLGITVQSTPEAFWKDFLSKNENYIPGWIEIGRIDKANQIDPNYFKK